MKAENNPNTLASIVTRHLDKPFKWGGVDMAGFDCIGLVRSVQKELGRQTSERMERYPIRDVAVYQNFYENDKDGMIGEMRKFFDEIGEEINPNYKMAGDIVLLSVNEKSLFMGVYLGKGNVLTSLLKHGVRVIALRENIKIIRVRRPQNG